MHSHFELAKYLIIMGADFDADSKVSRFFFFFLVALQLYILIVDEGRSHGCG
jgi:hypothetical protein